MADRMREGTRLRWLSHLGAAGWSSWDDAVEWAVTNKKSWRDVAQRLGTPYAHTLDAGRAFGVRIPASWEARLAEAEAHAAEHGTLLNVRGELSIRLSGQRTQARKAKTPSEIALRLDQLDPDWRLDKAGRTEAIRRRGLRTGNSFNAGEYHLKAVTDAGFDDVTDAIHWAITEHVGIGELGEVIGRPNDGGLLARLIACSPTDPLAATKHLRRSRHGHLEDDGTRVQCHECGLWYPRLSDHVQGHRDDDGRPLTHASYRERNGLAPDTMLSSAGGMEIGQTQLWNERFAAAGLTSWEDVLIYGATERMNTVELAEMLGTSLSAFLGGLSSARPDDPWSVTKPFRLSRFGHLEEDLDRAQCHDCGLWFERLYIHVRTHDDSGTKFAWKDYQARHGI